MGKANPDRRPDRLGRPARRPRPRTSPSFRLVGLVHARGGWPNPRALSIAHPRPTAARLSGSSPPPISKQAKGTSDKSFFPPSPSPPPDARLPFIFPPRRTQRWIQREQSVERRRRVRGAVPGARRGSFGGCFGGSFGGCFGECGGSSRKRKRRKRRKPRSSPHKRCCSPTARHHKKL